MLHLIFLLGAMQIKKILALAPKYFFFTNN